MWPPFLSLKILGLGRQVNWLYRPACVGRLCHSKYKMAATSDILYKSTALPQSMQIAFQDKLALFDASSCTMANTDIA